MTNNAVKSNKNPAVYVGCYTKPGSANSQSVFLYHLDMQTGALVFDSGADAGENASYLAVSPGNSHLYAVNELTQFHGQPGGGVAALSIDATTGRLTLLNQQRSHGGLPCYVSIDAKNRVALVANYLGGNIALLPIQADGRLSAATDVIQHTGSSVHPQRQRAPFAHSIVIDPANRFAIVSDLGIDKVIVYEIDYQKQKLVAHSEVNVTVGAGPRHFVFHPNGRWAYLIHELDTQITVFLYDAEAGTLNTLQNIPTLPADYNGENTSADIHISPNGRFVYGSNRGDDSITVFAVDQASGLLTFVDRHSSGGQIPRNFVIDPTGAYLLAANQQTDNIVTFRLDAVTGKMLDTGLSVKQYKPVCLKFMN